jgi:HSP20 family protein
MSANRKEETKMRNDLYSLVNEFNNMFYDGGYKGFPLDVIETENGYTVVAEIPGVKKEDIQIEFEDGVLAISASKGKKDNNVKYLIHERNNQKLRRTINFGDINEDTIKASYENGLLMVNLTVKKEEKTKKTIEIQ